MNQPRVQEKLTEAEKYLHAILTDDSGIDLAEFVFTDEMNEDRCYRVYPYQWAWFREPSPQVIAACARSVGKSESIMLEVASFPYNYPNQEQVLVVPEGTQGLNLTTRIQAKFEATRFMRETIPNIQSSGITQRPFTIKWGNGARFFVRLPQRDGRGLRGVHPVKLHIDEGQDLTTESYEETPEVVRTDIDGWKWKIYGVSKGIRGDFFWNATQPGSGWTVQQYTGMHRPGWDDEERESKIKSYSGYASPAYVRNVWGEPGDEANSIFVLANFMRCVDTREGSDYNTQEYFHKLITGDIIRSYTGVEDLAYSGEEGTDARMTAIESMLQFPSSHTSKYSTFWMGMDVGLVSDPTEIMIVAEYEVPGPEKSADKRAELAVPDAGVTRFKLLSRVSLKEIPAPLQAKVLMYIINHYKPKAFAMDSTGIGEPTFNVLQEMAGSSRFVTIANPNDDLLGSAQKALTVIKGYGFSNKIPVSIDETIASNLEGESPSKIIKEAGVYWNVADRATEVLRQWVDTQRFMLPYDMELVQDMNAQTFTLKKSKVDPWGRSSRSFSKGGFHILDGMRMMALAASQKPIEDFIASEKPKQHVPIIPRVGFG